MPAWCDHTTIYTEHFIHKYFHLVTYLQLHIRLYVSRCSMPIMYFYLEEHFSYQSIKQYVQLQ